VRVTDRELWDQAVAAITAEYADLPGSLKEILREKAVILRQLKGSLHRLAEEMHGASICAACGGECCVRGKCHVTVVDIIVMLVSGVHLSEPRFGRDFCPQLGERGCLMSPEFRPFNCITFNCERVEGLWEPGRIDSFYRLERDLRQHYGELEQLFDNRFMKGLLMSYERDVLVRQERMLRYAKR